MKQLSSFDLAEVPPTLVDSLSQTITQSIRSSHCKVQFVLAHVTRSCLTLSLHCRTTARAGVPTVRKLGRRGGKAACLSIRLCTLMSKALTRSLFRQEHNFTSVGNGSVGVRGAGSRVSRRWRSAPAKQFLPRCSVSIPKGSAAQPDFITDDLI